jgi:hypothetical protein
MIVIPPRDPNEDNAPDPAAKALGKFYEQFTNVQNLAEFHTALRKRDALYEMQHQEMAENPQDFDNLHPKDFFNQFHRRAEENDRTVVSEAPYRIRQQLRDVLWPERQTALDRAKETYKQLFINRQLAQLDQDRLYYLGKMADAANDQDRERYITALIGRLKLSGDVGLLYKEDAARLIENIPSDYDIFSFNREFANDPARAQRLLLYGAYPNVRPDLREDLVKEANSAATHLADGEPASDDLPRPSDPANDANSKTKEQPATTSNNQTVGKPPADISSDETATTNPIEVAAAVSKKENASASKHRIKEPGEKGDVRAAYGETNGLYPQLNTIARDPYEAVYDPKKAHPDSLKELQKARADIAQVERHRRAAGATTGIERKDLRLGDVNEQRQWKLASDAANQSSDLPPDVRHFFMRAHTGAQKPDWAGNREPYRTYGPFINVGGGPVPRSTLVYIDFYQGVPLAKDKGR